MKKFILPLFILLITGFSFGQAIAQVSPAPAHPAVPQARVTPPHTYRHTYKARIHPVQTPAAVAPVNGSAATPVNSNTIAPVNGTATADSTQQEQITDPSLKGQYEYLLSRSKTYYGFKLINPSRLAAFYKNVTDSIRSGRTSLKTIQAKVSQQTQTIAALNDQIKGKESSLASSNSKLDEISFMGIAFDKSTYNMIVWALIILLALSLAFVVIRSAKNIHEAKYRTGLYEEISQEYQAYKTKANEKEKKLARELQDERNKLEEYKNRGL